MIFGLPPDVFYGVLFPVALGTLLGLLAYPPFRKARPPSSRQKILDPKLAQVPSKASGQRSSGGEGTGLLSSLLLALGVGGAYLAAFFGMRGLPEMPPVSAEGWLVPLAAFSLLLAPVWRRLETAGAQFLFGLLFAVLASVASVWPLVQSGALSLRDGVTNVSSCSLATACALLLMLRIEAASGRGVAIAGQLILASGAAVLLILSSSAFLGLIVGASAAVLGPWTVVWWLRRDFSLLPSATPVLGIVVAGALLQGHYYANLSLEILGLLFGATALLALPMREHTARAYAVRLIGIALFLGLASVLRWYELV